VYMHVHLDLFSCAKIGERRHTHMHI
jgi:hypothetical protein